MLHLAATSALLRRRVFQQGLTTVCHHLKRRDRDRDREQEKDQEEEVQEWGELNVLPRQLGLSRDALEALRRDLPVQEAVLEASKTLLWRLAARQREERERGVALGVDEAATEDVVLVRTMHLSTSLLSLPSNSFYSLVRQSLFSMFLCMCMRFSVYGCVCVCVLTVHVTSCCGRSRMLCGTASLCPATRGATRCTTACCWRSTTAIHTSLPLTTPPSLLYTQTHRHRQLLLAFSFG